MAALSFIVVLCLTSGLWLGAEGCRGKCPECEDGWSQFGCYCYRYEAGPKTWADGEIHCRSQNANLASIHSSEEHKFLRSLVQRFGGGAHRTFVGGHDHAQEGTWWWSDGSPFEFTLWPQGEPNNYNNNEDCMEINFHDKPNDIDCSGTKPYICAKPL